MKKSHKNRMLMLETVFLFTCMIIILIGCFPRTSIPVPEVKPRPESKIISPDDFKSLIVGKTKIEVKEIIGRPPDMVMQNHMNNDPTGVWSYASYKSKITAKGRYIYDPIVGKDVRMISIYFKDEVVERVDITF